MSSLFFHNGATPDLFLIACAAISLGSAFIALRARSRRNAQPGSAHN